MNSDNAAGGALDQLRGVLGECEKGAAGFDHNCLSEKECTVAIWHRRELPSTGQMAGFLKLASTPQGAKRGRQGSEGRRNPPPRTEGAQRCGRLFEVKNRPRANPVGGVGG